MCECATFLSSPFAAVTDRKVLALHRPFAFLDKAHINTKATVAQIDVSTPLCAICLVAVVVVVVVVVVFVVVVVVCVISVSLVFSVH